MERLEIFNQYRSLLFAIAYRMLGSVTDADDMIQEAWLRWQLTQVSVQSPKAFLSCLITRLCIDQLRSARSQREKYVGIWLPEPLIAINDIEDNAELTESLSFAFLTLIECLSPTERAIFLLREVFDYEYSEIAQTVGKSISNCRQIVHRARQHLVLRRPSSRLSIQQQEEMIEQFLISWNQGDLHNLIALMAEDLTFWSDGGGRVTAAQRPLQGCQKVARFLVALRRSRLIPTFNPQIITINHQPGILNTFQGNPQSTFSFEFSASRIKSIFAVVNPEKLRAVKRSVVV
ncbi:RNA polymerase sigma-70 factor [Chroococcus sp. FPU101]|uniref:RNA polymerase sigma-70 factor n=1 Tax=Chroococcus sp. FPU101 TaxID=1974212 RepID=UPI001A903597|nr:RNA polymerase sigma-70 factor [Chroococcus sp. FPU101]GFE70922.1 RNA polymerase sigma-70 factor, ECF subfamily [Chroococcus sp. FPU101]